MSPKMAGDFEEVHVCYVMIRKKLTMEEFIQRWMDEGNEMMIHIQRHRLSELLQAVREKEQQGFECVTPIRKVSKPKKLWNYRYGDEDFRNFGGVDEHTIYFVKMRKVTE